MGTSAGGIDFVCIYITHAPGRLHIWLNPNLGYILFTHICGIKLVGKCY